MTDVLQTVDVCGALRTWLRTVEIVNELVGQRVFFGIPPKATWPLVSLPYEDSSFNLYLPMQTDTIQIDCWGSPHPTPGKSNKLEAKEVMVAVTTALRSIKSGTAFDANVICLGASILSAPWVPDPDSNQSRYAITAEVTAKPAD